MKKFEFKLVEMMGKGSVLAYGVLWVRLKVGRKLSKESQVELIKQLGDGSKKAKRLLFIYRKDRSLSFEAWKRFAELDIAGNKNVNVLLHVAEYWYNKSRKTPEDYSDYILNGMRDTAKLRKAYFAV